MIWLISSARISMTCFLCCLLAGGYVCSNDRSKTLVEKTLAHLVQLRTHAAIQYQVPHPGDHAPDQRGIHRGLDQDLSSRALLERPAHPVQIGGRQRRGGRDGGPHLPGPRV